MWRDISAIVIPIVSVIFFLGGGWSDLKALEKKIETHEENDKIEVKENRTFKDTLLYNIGQIKGSLNAMEKSISQIDAVENRRGKRVIIYRENGK